MTKTEHKAATERCEKATEGPWKWDGPVWGYGADEEAPWLLGDRLDEVLTGWIEAKHKADAEFIAASRDDLPAALDMLDVLMVDVLPYFVDPSSSDDDAQRALFVAREKLREWEGIS